MSCLVRFWKRLKNFERILSMPPRRKRFFFTCILGTPFEHRKNDIVNWQAATLYEPRWHCVLAFLKRLCPVLCLFRACWDEDKYKEAVDAHSAAVQEEVQQVVICFGLEASFGF